jgi:hypothetical protein
METMANIIKAVANKNSLPCYDMWHQSGINKWNWSVYGAEANAVASPPKTGVPYPNNGDQLHMSTLGYTYTGNLIAKFVETL